MIIDSSSVSSSDSTNNPPNPDPAGDDFARPPPDFDIERAKEEFLKVAGKSFLDARDEVDDSIEDEIQRKISEVEKARDKPLSPEEQERMANSIRSLREGAWLEGLKLELVGKDSVPIEYFNRIVAENEDSIRKVAHINAKAEHELAKKDAQIKDLKMSGDQNNKFQEELIKCEKHRDELETQIRKLKVELQQQKSKQNDTTAANDTLTKYESQVTDLRKKLEAANKDLTTARQTLSKRYEEIESLKKQKANSRGREDSLKEQARELMDENKKLNDTSKQLSAIQKQVIQLELERVNCQAKATSLEEENKRLKSTAPAREESEDLRKRIAGLEAGWAKCKDELKALESENKSLKDASQGSSGEPSNPGDLDTLREQIARLEAKIATRDKSITTLRTQLEKELAGPPQGTPAELQARCVSLRNARDNYRNRWARGVMANNENLLLFWEAVENTNQEIKKLYEGVSRLGNALGLSGEVLDTPAALDKIIAKVSEEVSGEVDEHQTPQLSILHLLNANARAQVQIETLKRELDKAQVGKSEDEIKAQLRIVDEETVEQRVSMRTQTYRQHRGAIIAHIFQAQREFLELADRSVDRDAIEALVDRFLQPLSLPRVQLAQNDPTGR